MGRSCGRDERSRAGLVKDMEAVAASRNLSRRDLVEQARGSSGMSRKAKEKAEAGLTRLADGLALLSGGGLGNIVRLDVCLGRGSGSDVALLSPKSQRGGHGRGQRNRKESDGGLHCDGLRECGELERKLMRVKECGWEVEVSECIEVIER